MHDKLSTTVLHQTNLNKVNKDLHISYKHYYLMHIRHVIFT